MDIRQYMSQLFDRGEDPYGLTGKRDDTMEMFLAMMGQREVPQEWGLQDEMLVEDQVNPPAPPPAQNSWEAFQAMNPDLDYAAVARQAGGTPGSFPVENEFGGAISEMPSSPEQQAQVRDLMDYVQNQIPQDEFARKQDPRSRAYDPGGAEQLLTKMKQDQEAQAMSAQTRIQEIQAQAAMKEAEAYEMLASQGKTSGGYPYGGSGGAPSASTQLSQAKMSIDNILSMMIGDDGTPETKQHNDRLKSDADQIKMLASVGRFDEARAIAERYISQDPASAGPPPGAAELAQREGTSVVTPTGGKYRTDPNTGELVYIG